jgi:hypothetical protein
MRKGEQGMTEAEALRGLEDALEGLNRAVQRIRTDLIEQGADVLILGNGLINLTAEVDRAYARLDVLRMAREG